MRQLYCKVFLQSTAAWRYYKVGQELLKTRASNLLQSEAAL